MSVLAVARLHQKMVAPNLRDVSQPFSALLHSVRPAGLFRGPRVFFGRRCRKEGPKGESD